MLDINNPGNTRPLHNDKWQGELEEVKGFSSFDTMTNGIRAYFKSLHTAIFVHGRKTVQAYIGAYAPPTENQTDSYIHLMCAGTGLLPTSEIPTQTDQLVLFAKTQFKIENGANDLTDEDILAGLQAANCF